MCTVTYIPRGKGFILTSNRDESPARAANDLMQKKVNGEMVTYPVDVGAGGTWIAASSLGRVVCLLNGAFRNHKRQPPYKRSRGLMVLDFFEYPSVIDFVEGYDLEGMEPFTLLMMEDEQLWELRWTGEEQFFKKYDDSLAHVWSSATLYNQKMRAKRDTWFEDWKAKHSKKTASAILKFHQTGGEGDERVDIMMNRDNVVRTVSITQIVVSDAPCMKHYNVLDGSIKEKGLIMDKEKVCG